MENKVKDLENDLTQAAEKGKAAEARSKAIAEEKAGLEAGLKRAQGQEASLKADLEKSKTSVKSLEGEKATLSRQLSQVRHK